MTKLSVESLPRQVKSILPTVMSQGSSTQLGGTSSKNPAGQRAGNKEQAIYL